VPVARATALSFNPAATKAIASVYSAFERMSQLEPFWEALEASI
jgi:hypothetical protein